MKYSFFDKPILNSPYEYPMQHWELDESGQPTDRIIETRRRAEYITPIPRPKKQRRSMQREMSLWFQGFLGGALIMGLLMWFLGRCNW